MMASDALVAVSHRAADAYFARQNAATRATELALQDCWVRNPFTVRHRNFSQQCLLRKKSPALADRLEAEARVIDRAL